MFEVLVFVYENYWCGGECPEPRQLERKLNAAGFEADEIHMAIDWLNGLNQIAQNTHWLADAMDTVHVGVAPGLKAGDSLRIYSAAEQTQLGPDGQGFVIFLESAGVLPSTLREVVIERAMAVASPISLDDLKIIVLMVYWRFGEEPDALILDELCGAEPSRLAH